MKPADRRMRPTMHILVCTNQRPPDAPLPCCGSARGGEVADALRREVSRAGLVGRIWITQTGCLTFCNIAGATVVAYPQSKWFTEVKPEDAPALLQELLSPAPTG